MRLIHVLALLLCVQAVALADLKVTRKNGAGDYNARHIKPTNVIDAPPEACNPGHTESETDGWYIDLAMGFSCDTDRPAGPPARGTRPDCVDQYHVRHTGAGKLGFPVMVRTTF